MSLCVNDLLKLDSLSNFRLIVGASGLERTVEGTGIADWEFADGVTNEEAKFEKNTIVLSSLLFAKENEELLIGAIKKLVVAGVSALAFKTIIIKEIPKDAIQLADELGFPIFAFDNAYFEDILVEIHNAIIATNQLEAMEEILRTIITNDLSSSEVKKMAIKLNPRIMKNIFAAYYYCHEGFSDGEILRITGNYRKNKNDLYESIICRYDGGLLIMLSANHFEQNKYADVVRDIFKTTVMQKSDITHGFSGIYTIDELNVCIKESSYACITARIENKNGMNFGDIGINQFLIPNKDVASLTKYMTDYLNPIFAKENNQNQELMDTAITFVKGDGNFKNVSESLFIHENTLRYRLAKLHKILNPGTSEFAFYQNLSVAIKLYLIREM